MSVARSPVRGHTQGRLAGSIVGVLFVRGLGIGVAIFSLPAYLRFFADVAALGVWFTLLSALGWLLTLDLGVGNGLRNRVTEGLATRNRIALHELISSAYVVSSVVALVMALVLVPIVTYADWNAVFNVPRDVLPGEDLRLGLMVALAGVLAQLVLRNAQSLAYALQRPVLASAVSPLTSLSMLAAVLTLPSGEAGNNFVMLAWVYLATSLTPYLALSWWIFGASRLRGMWPRWTMKSRAGMRAVGGLGIAFFVMNLCYMAIVTTDAVLVAVLTGPQHVVTYQVYFRPFGLISSLFIIAMSPTWSAVTAAWAVRDVDWVSRVAKRMMLAGVVASCVTLGLVPVMQPVVDLWLGRNTADLNLLETLSFAALTISAMWTAIMANIASGIGELKVQVSMYVVGTAAKVPLSIWWCRLTDSYIGVVLATSAVLTAYSVVQAMWLRAELSSAAEHRTDSRDECGVAAVQPSLRQGESED